MALQELSLRPLPYSLSWIAPPLSKKRRSKSRCHLTFEYLYLTAFTTVQVLKSARLCPKNCAMFTYYKLLNRNYRGLLLFIFSFSFPPFCFVHYKTEYWRTFQMTVIYPAACTESERQSGIGRLSALSPVLSQSAEAHQRCREGECTSPALKEKKQNKQACI